jgi:hypothetical protein
MPIDIEKQLTKYQMAMIYNHLNGALEIMADNRSLIGEEAELEEAVYHALDRVNVLLREAYEEEMLAEEIV